MKVKFANRIYEVLFTKELAGLTMYAVEDEPNHIDWLINVEVIDAEKKELKKIEQNPAWSEEDKRMLEDIIFELEENQENISGVGYKIDWLKSLKDRYTWKPSDEQMDALEYYMHTLVCNEYKEILFGLYADLKKLREE